MKLSSKARLSFLVLIILMGSVVVYATTIGPAGVYDTPWGNFTVGVKTPSIELNGVTRTTWWGAVNPFDQNLNTSDEVDFAGYSLNSVNKTDIFAYPQQDYSYLISVDNSTGTPDYCAKNGTTGEIEFSGIDAATVIQSASTNGRKIFLKAGTYIIPSGNPAIAVTEGNRVFEGAGASTILQYNGAIGFLFKVGYQAEQIENSVFRNIKFVGNITEDENHFIGFGNVTNVLVEGCVFDGAGDESLSLTKDTRDIIIRSNWFVNKNSYNLGSFISVQCRSVLIEGNIFSSNIDSEGDGVALEAIAGTESVGDVIISNNVFYGEGNVHSGVNVYAGVFDIDNLIIVGNLIYNYNFSGIYIGHSGSNNVRTVLINQNVINGGGNQTASRSAIWINNRCQNVIVSNNEVLNWGIEKSDAYGIQTSAPNTILQGNWLKNIGNQGIIINGDGSQAIGNTIVDSQREYTLGAISIGADYVKIIGNSLVDGYRGIRTSSTATDGVIIGNSFESISIEFDNTSGGNFSFRDNIGFVTENTGSVTVYNTNTTVVITPGLASNATSITITPSWDGSPYISASDVTTFTVTFTDPTATKTIYWTATYAP